MKTTPKIEEIISCAYRASLLCWPRSRPRVSASTITAIADQHGEEHTPRALHLGPLASAVHLSHIVHLSQILLVKASHAVTADFKGGDVWPGGWQFLITTQMPPCLEIPALCLIHPVYEFHPVFEET